VKRPSKWGVYNLGRKAGQEEAKTHHDDCMEPIKAIFSDALHFPNKRDIEFSKKMWSAIKECIKRDGSEIW